MTTERRQTIVDPDYLPARREDRRRTPGPLTPYEVGPVAGDVIVQKGDPIFLNGRTQRAPYDIRLRPPLDKAEVGTAWNGYDPKS